MILFRSALQLSDGRTSQDPIYDIMLKEGVLKSNLSIKDTLLVSLDFTKVQPFAMKVAYETYSK